MIILDSDIVSDFLRQYAPAIEWFRALGDEEIALPGYVVMELIQGVGTKLSYAYWKSSSLLLRLSGQQLQRVMPPW